MPGPVYLTISSGQTVSSAGYLERSDRALTIEVSSYAAGVLTLQCTQVSGTAPFSPVLRSDGSGAPFTVFSGTGGGWGIIPLVPTPYIRLSLAAAPTTTVSFTLLPR